MEDLGQLEGKRLNDLFPINYFHREKIECLVPLRFERIYYQKYDRFYVKETGGVFRIISRPGKNATYLYEHVSGSKELKIGYTTAYIQNDVYENFYKKGQPNPIGYDQLRILLGSKDYYHVADILYDLSNEVEEIPDRLFNYIMEICDETNSRIH